MARKKRISAVAGWATTIIGLPGLYGDAIEWLRWIEHFGVREEHLMEYLGFAPLILIAGLLGLMIADGPRLVSLVTHRQHRKFTKLAEPAQTCLETLIKAAENLELPWMLPENWASLRAQIIALEKELGYLDIPRPRVPESDDFEALHNWMEYLSHLTPMARRGRLADARAIVFSEDLESRP